MRLIIALLAVTFAATAQVRAQSFGCGRDLKIDDKLRKQFLDFHNQKRMNVAKGAEGKFKSAKNMYKLSWSCELEFKAQKHIQSCPGKINGLGSTGANNMIWSITGGTFTQSKVKELVDKTLVEWWKNAQHYGLGPDNTYPGGHLFNVANIINAATTQVGCTYNECGNTLEILCLYDEVAYLKGKILYDSGRPCTKSDECMTYRGSSCDARTGLCVKPEEKPDDMKSTVCPKGRGMTDKMRNTILDLHNDFRSLVARGKAEDRLVNNGKGFAPQGASMLRMEYNCDLEKTAADYAARCIYAHSQPYERDNAGENLYTVSIDNADKNKAGEWATRGWFSELKEFGVGKDNLLSQWLWDRPKRQNNPEIKIGHYTQMVWGTTSKIGCGIQNCPGVQTLVVCHYKDAGNVLTNPPRQIYEVGQVCSHCPNGYSCDKDMLCAKRTR